MRETEKLLITNNFSFSHSVFKRLILQTRKNQGLFGKGLIQDQTRCSVLSDLDIHCQRKQLRYFTALTGLTRLLTPLEKMALENIVGKGENAGNHFLLFSQCFLFF